MAACLFGVTSMVSAVERQLTALGPGGDPAPGWVARWRFDATTGSVAADDSGNFNGAGLGGISFDTGSVPGAVGGAVAFVPDQAFAVGHPLVGASEFTFTFWVKPTLLVTDVPFIRQWNPDGKVLVIGMLDTDATALSFTVMGDDDTQQSVSIAGVIAAGVWQFIVVKSDGVTHQMFVNGVDVFDFYRNPNPSGPPLDSVSPMGIGAQINGQATPSRGYDGALDECRLYHKITTPAEDAALFAMGSI